MPHPASCHGCSRRVPATRPTEIVVHLMFEAGART
jgi:hypothetical protein